MEVIVEVIIEMGSILIMGTICFALYLNGKLFLIKIGLIDNEQVDESKKEDKPDLSKWLRLHNHPIYEILKGCFYTYQNNIFYSQTSFVVGVKPPLHKLYILYFS